MPPPEREPRASSGGLIARIDERTKALQESLGEFKDTVEKRLDDISELIDEHYTKKADFDPIKKIVYGFVGFLLLSMGGMFIAVIVRSNNLPMEVSTINHSIIKPVPTIEPPGR